MNLKEIICDFFKIKTDKKIEVVECKPETKEIDPIDACFDHWCWLKKIARITASQKGWYVLDMDIGTGFQFNVMADDKKILECAIIVQDSRILPVKIRLRGHRSNWGNVIPRTDILEFLMYEEA